MPNTPDVWLKLLVTVKLPAPFSVPLVKVSDGARSAFEIDSVPPAIVRLPPPFKVVNIVLAATALS